MAKAAKYRVGKDVDLKQEIVRDLAGRRITNRRVKKIVKYYLWKCGGIKQKTGGKRKERSANNTNEREKDFQ